MIRVPFIVPNSLDRPRSLLLIPRDLHNAIVAYSGLSIFAQNDLVEVVIIVPAQPRVQLAYRCYRNGSDRFSMLWEFDEKIYRDVARRFPLDDAVRSVVKWSVGRGEDETIALAVAATPRATQDFVQMK